MATTLTASHRSGRTLLSLIASAAVCASLGACGGEDSPASDPNGRISEGYDAGSGTWGDVGSYDASSYDEFSSQDAGSRPDMPDASEDANTADTSTEPPAPIEEPPEWVENDWVDTVDDNLATFSVDVDTASYTLARQALDEGRLPDPGGIRVEEFLNFFDYGYTPPTAADEHPFAVVFEGGPSLFGDDLQMLRMGLQGRIYSDEDRPGANLVFLVDVSGSMSSAGGLPLIQESLRVLLDSLDDRDHISMITYAGSDAVALEPTSGADRATILAAINELSSGGSTAGEAGIRRAYAFAQENFVEGGINRIILCTDGDFNVGMTGEGLIQFAETMRGTGITITSMLFNSWGADAFLEQLANRANGNYFFIGNRTDAVRTLGTELLGTLMVIAGDLKVQAVLNRDVVSRYRIVGYDNRMLEDDEFNDDTVDAADVGAGHDVTAMLEVELHDTTEMAEDALVAWVQLRYKRPGETESILVEYPLQLSDLRPDIDAMSPSFRLAMGVAEFAEILRNSRHTEGARFDDILTLLDGAPNSADVGELRRLVVTAQSLWGE